MVVVICSTRNSKKNTKSKLYIKNQSGYVDPLAQGVIFEVRKNSTLSAICRVFFFFFSL